eukprot:350646-Chlamydomonas_euryale.AAC.1
MEAAVAAGATLRIGAACGVEMRAREDGEVRIAGVDQKKCGRVEVCLEGIVPWGQGHDRYMRAQVWALPPASTCFVKVECVAAYKPHASAPHFSHLTSVSASHILTLHFTSRGVLAPRFSQARVVEGVHVRSGDRDDGEEELIACDTLLVAMGPWTVLAGGRLGGWEVGTLAWVRREARGAEDAWRKLGRGVSGVRITNKNGADKEGSGVLCPTPAVGPQPFVSQSLFPSLPQACKSISAKRRQNTDKHDWFNDVGAPGPELVIPLEGVKSTSLVYNGDNVRSAVSAEPFALFCAEDRNGCHLEVWKCGQHGCVWGGSGCFAQRPAPGAGVSLAEGSLRENCGMPCCMTLAWWWPRADA